VDASVISAGLVIIAEPRRPSGQRCGRSPAGIRRTEALRYDSIVDSEVFRDVGPGEDLELKFEACSEGGGINSVVPISGN